VADWQGFFYDGVTADKRPVSVRLEPNGITVRIDEFDTRFWPIGNVRLTPGSFSGAMVKLEYGADPVQAVIVDAPGFTDALARSFPSMRRLARPGWTARRLGWLAVATIAVLGGTFGVLAPAAASWTAARVPTTWEEELGKRVAADMAPESKRCDAAGASADLRSVLDRLLDARPESPYSFTLHVVRDTVVNAFAAPGGYVVVNSGLLQATRTPEELAGVLAHEVQHVLQRHTTRGILREAPLRILIALVFGGSSVETIATMAGSLGALGYRRGDESEADREGLKLMVAAAIDPAGMVSFMQTLSDRSGGPRVISYLTSHPHSADRVAALRTLAAESRGAWRPLMSVAEWKRVQAICDR